MVMESSGTDICKDKMHSESDYAVIDSSTALPAEIPTSNGASILQPETTITEQNELPSIIPPIVPIAEAPDKHANTQTATDTTFSPKAYAFKLPLSENLETI